MSVIMVDADGCPVKEEIYRVAKRHGLKVTLVANSWMRTPNANQVELVLVQGSLDAADDWIVEHVAENDIVVTADIPLASRCLEKGALVLGHKGRVFTEDSIAGFLANRELQSHLRELGVMTGGPAPMQKKDRSRFLHALDEIIRSTFTNAARR